MADTTIAEHQRTALKILDEHILDSAVLVNKCPLDYGRHILAPRFDLGNLQKLSTELYYHVLGYVDVKSLLVFRRVSQNAMTTVDSMIEYRKVMKNAANCIRMAVGIRTAHMFNIKQLFAKLCQRTCDGENYGKRQRTCDGENCGRLAPYLDVFTMTRRCLSISGGCRTSFVPISRTTSLFDSVPLKELSKLCCFTSIPGHYGHTMYTQVLSENKERKIYYDYPEIKRRFMNDSNQDDYHDYEVNHNHGLRYPYRMLCSTRAPWMSRIGEHTENGMFCDLCCFLDYIEEDLESLRSLKRRGYWTPGPSPSTDAFMTVVEFKIHMKEEHGETFED